MGRHPEMPLRTGITRCIDFALNPNESVESFQIAEKLQIECKKFLYTPTQFSPEINILARVCLLK
jgi:hypothetical protein